LGLGHTALEAGDAEAEAHFTRALERSPGSTEALHGRAAARVAKGDKAGAAADRAAAISGLSVETARLYDHARWRGMLGNVERSVSDYDALLELDPRDVQALINRGVMLQQLGRDAEALESWDRAVAADPSYPNAWVKRGMGRFMAGQGDLARTDLLEALARAPADWPMREQVEAALQMLGPQPS
jgi:tetratricopeptide (TPR) repeat protein